MWRDTVERLFQPTSLAWITLPARFTKADVMGDYEYDPGIDGEVHGMDVDKMRVDT